ncbi:MAG: hypothetical protein Q4C56_02590 [Peptococcaceae bacterium]|nr:hypothetical protein [Peptococcaceae bacterium]
MNNTSGLFDAKLAELAQIYHDLYGEIDAFRDLDHDAVRRERARLAHDCTLAGEQLKSQLIATRLVPAEELSRAQIDYCDRAQMIMDSLRKQSADDPCKNNSKAELSALFAEFAVDFASLAVTHALLAVLSAMDDQMTEDEKEEERP